MVFSNIENNEAGLPVVFNVSEAPQEALNLLITLPTSCSQSKKSKFNGYIQLAYLQDGDNDMYSIILDGHDYSSMIIINDVDKLPYHVRDVLISSGRASLKRNNLRSSDCSIRLSGNLNMCIGLDRIGLAKNYQTRGRGSRWMRWGRTSSGITDEGVLDNPYSIHETNNRQAFIYYQQNNEITRKIKNPMDLMKVAFLVEYEQGTLSKVINKCGRKIPHGSLFVLTKNDDGKLKLEVEGRDLEDNVNHPRQPIPTKSYIGHEIYSAQKDWEGSGVIHYKEWFRFVRETGRNSDSYQLLINSIKDIGYTFTELFGLTLDGDIIYGLKCKHDDRNDFSLLLRFPRVDIPLEVPEELRDVDESIKKKRAKSNVATSEKKAKDEIIIDTSDLSAEDAVRLNTWLQSHISYTTSRSLEPSSNPLSWFPHYMNHLLSLGEEFGEEDLELFNRLREQVK